MLVFFGGRIMASAPQSWEFHLSQMYWGRGRDMASACLVTMSKSTALGTEFWNPKRRCWNAMKYCTSKRSPLGFLAEVVYTTWVELSAWSNQLQLLLGSSESFNRKAKKSAPSWGNGENRSKMIQKAQVHKFSHQRWWKMMTKVRVGLRLYDASRNHFGPWYWHPRHPRLKTAWSKFVADSCLQVWCWARGALRCGRRQKWPTSSSSKYSKRREEYIEYIGMHILKKTKSNCVRRQQKKVAQGQRNTQNIEFGRLLPSCSEWLPVARQPCSSQASPAWLQTPRPGGCHKCDVEVWTPGENSKTSSSFGSVTVRIAFCKMRIGLLGVQKIKTQWPRTIRIYQAKWNAALTALQTLKSERFWIILNCVHLKIAGTTSSSAVAKRAGDLCKVTCVLLWHLRHIRHRLRNAKSERSTLPVGHCVLAAGPTSQRQIWILKTWKMTWEMFRKYFGNISKSLCGSDFDVHLGIFASKCRSFEHLVLCTYVASLRRRRRPNALTLHTERLFRWVLPALPAYAVIAKLPLFDHLPLLLQECSVKQRYACFSSFFVPMFFPYFCTPSCGLSFPLSLSLSLSLSPSLSQTWETHRNTTCFLPEFFQCSSMSKFARSKISLRTRLRAIFLTTRELTQ